MPSLSERMLARGCALHIHRLHGEPVQILDGPNAGRPGYFAVIETMPDEILLTDLGTDPRAKIVMRFIDGTEPPIAKTGKVKLGNGKVYQAVQRDEANFLTQDFWLTELVAGKDS